MKKIFFTTVFSVFVLNINAKTAYIDLQKIVQDNNSFQSFMKEFNKKKDNLEEFLKKEQEKIQTKAKELQINSKKISKEEQEKKMMELQQEVMVLQDKAQKEEKKLQKELENAAITVTEKIKVVAKDMLAKNPEFKKYDSVTDLTSFLVYPEDDNITFDIMKRLNKEKINLDNNQKTQITTLK